MHVCVCVCFLADTDGRRAKGEGGPRGQEAVKASSGYEDQTAGQTVLKATAATALKVWVTLLDTGDTHTHSCIYSPRRILCWCVCMCASALINMQWQMCTRMRLHSVTQALTGPTPSSTKQIHFKGLVLIVNSHV